MGSKRQPQARNKRDPSAGKQTCGRNIQRIKSDSDAPSEEGAHVLLRTTKEEEAAEASEEWMNIGNVEDVMGFTLKLQVPKTFKINTKEVDSMPWAIKQFRQAYHIEVALRD